MTSTAAPCGARARTRAIAQPPASQRSALPERPQAWRSGIIFLVALVVFVFQRFREDNISHLSAWQLAKLVTGMGYILGWSRPLWSPQWGHPFVRRFCAQLIF